jgi:peptidoglycan/LPS O-acetylase OafA/YrhL
MDKVLEFRNEIYGFLTLWILFFHVEIWVGMDVNIPILTSFVVKGNFCVDVFLFLSGYCLCLSLNRDSNIKRFYTKRFKRVVVTYLIISVPFFIWKSLEEITTHQFINFFFDLSGLSFWIYGCQNAWFVEAILLFYIITPPIYHIVRKSVVRSLVLLAIVYVLLIKAYYYFPYIGPSVIAWTRLPIFVIGIIMASHCPHFDFKCSKMMTWCFTLALIIGLLCIQGHFSGFWCWMQYAIAVIPSLWVLNGLFSVMPARGRYYFNKLGEISLEVYLVHIMTLHILKFYGLDKQIGQWMYILLPLMTIPLALMVPKISKRLIEIKKKPHRGDRPAHTVG